jgi:hypothetical protein
MYNTVRTCTKERGRRKKARAVLIVAFLLLIYNSTPLPPGMERCASKTFF